MENDRLDQAIVGRWALEGMNMADSGESVSGGWLKCWGADGEGRLSGEYRV